MFKYSVEISLKLNGVYIPDSDIHIATFDSYVDAVYFAKNISVQDANMYECYVYQLNENSEILNTTRIF